MTEFVPEPGGYQSRIEIGLDGEPYETWGVPNPRGVRRDATSAGAQSAPAVHGDAAREPGRRRRRRERPSVTLDGLGSAAMEVIGEVIDDLLWP